jgi:DNA topoisomerase-1
LCAIHKEFIVYFRGLSIHTAVVKRAYYANGVELKGVVVVESPAKAKTLEAFLGGGYRVIASYGHIRDLVPKNGSVDTKDHYKMLWLFSERGKKQVKEITDALKKADSLYLATDPDREGEAISWHILEALKEQHSLSAKNVQRVVFHEITKQAVLNAFQNPKSLDENLINAYLARRALDYLFGFSLSPVLWRKMPGAGSAGRVQSVALRLIVERELEIQAFISDEYWSIHGEFSSQNGKFSSTLELIDCKKLEKLDIKNEKMAQDIKSSLEQKLYYVSKIEKKSVKRNPYAPFTTSTLQQDSVRKFGFSSKKTMLVAQKLYEGISLDGVMTGLITYMRTDSTSLSQDAISSSRDYISSEFGQKYLPKSPRIYKTKTKNAQEAHEAIRPTSCARTPDSVKDHLSRDEFMMYDLIWKRTIASQMASAVIDQVLVNVSSTDKAAVFKATGSTISFDGFLKLYVESTDEPSDEKNKKLPAMSDGEELDLIEVNTNQHFTQPPPRFNEASLIKKLEDLGIGRPSTYASIINVLQERKYVSLEKRTFNPKSTGVLVTSFLRKFFSQYVEYGFTADLETKLDDISNGRLSWEGVLDKFWTELGHNVSQSLEISITNVIDFIEEDLGQYVFSNLDESRGCPSCNVGKLGLRLGKFGAFLGCSNYPDCKYTRRIGVTSDEAETSFASGQSTKITVGTDPNNENDTIFLKSGPYGFYFEWEKTCVTPDNGKRKKQKPKPKRLSVPKFVSDPSEITIDDVITLDNLPKILGEHPETKAEIHLALGRFGPFLKFNGKSYRLDKDIGFIRTTLKDALMIINKKSAE